MLAVLEQNPSMQWSELIGDISIEQERPSDIDEIAVDKAKGSSDSDDFASFKL